MVYDYDTGTEKFKELTDKRAFHQEVEPMRLHRVGSEFYYTGYETKLMSLTLVF